MNEWMEQWINWYVYEYFMNGYQSLKMINLSIPTNSVHPSDLFQYYLGGLLDHYEIFAYSCKRAWL